LKTIQEMYEEASAGAKQMADLIKGMRSAAHGSFDAMKVVMMSAAGSAISQSILGAAEGLRREIREAKESAWITLPSDHSHPHPMERADGSNVRLPLSRGSEFVVAIRSIARFCKTGEGAAVIFNNGDILYTSMGYDEVHTLITGEPVDRKTVY